MARTPNNGTCLLCQQKFTKAAITRHISACLDKKLSLKEESPKKSEPILMLEIVAYKIFWLVVEVRGRTTLDQLDTFLRDIWLECCGHLSQFTIHGQRYDSYCEDSDEQGMDIQMGKVLSHGTHFEYTYDFGTSTDLVGRVVHVRKGEIKKSIVLLGQNEMPEAECGDCDASPGTICPYCLSPLCKKCTKKHACFEDEGDEYTLPLVNSPRAGSCGYEGPEVDLKKYMPDY